MSAQTIFAAYTLSFILSCIESKDIHASFIYVTIIVGIELLLFFLVLLSKNILAKRQAIMEEKIDQMLTRKILEIPFSYLEDPKYLELRMLRLVLIIWVRFIVYLLVLPLYFLI